MPSCTRLGILVSACLVAPLLAGPVAAQEGAAAAEDIARRWESAFNRADFVGVAALYAEDGCRMPPNEKTITGRSAITASLQNAGAPGSSRVKITVTASAVGGDQASAFGYFDLTTPEGEPLGRGRWMNSLRKVADGWRIQCDIWNSEEPATVVAVPQEPKPAKSKKTKRD